MAMLKDEANIMKSAMIKIDDSHCMIVFQSYHTERGDNNKIDSSLSKYRWIARVFDTDTLTKMVNDWYDGPNCLDKCRFPGDPDPWFLCTGKDASNKAIANWLNTKFKKMMSWEAGMQHLAGYKKETAKRTGGIYPDAAYKVDGYVDPSGAQVSLTDKAELLKRVNTTLYRVEPSNRKPKTTANKLI
jgi:hypothetical protein